MNLSEISYFLTLAKELHFSRSAEQLKITQPTLSQAIKNLERELGIFLFERNPQKVTLTKEGEKFLPFAIAAIEQLKKGKEEVGENSGKIRGKVTLGVIPTICPYLVPKLLIRIRKDLPEVSISLFELTTSLLLEFLKAGKIDIGILALPIKDKGVCTTQIHEEPFYLAVQKKNPVARSKNISFKDLSDQKFLVLQEGHCFGDQTLEFCKLSRRSPQIIFEGDSLGSVLKLVEAGEGITLVPEMAIDKKTYPGISFLPFLKPPPSRKLAVTWRLTSPLGRTERAVMELIKLNTKSL